MALEQKGPMVSQATGTKRYDLARSEYFASLLSDMLSAAPAECWDVTARWDDARVSATIASQIKLFPACQGINVIPSGRLPSVLDRPVGFFAEGMLAR